MQAMELYDEALALAVSPDDAMGYSVSLKSNYRLAVGREAIEAQSLLINGNEYFPNARFDGWFHFLKKKKFSGPDGWVEFLGFVSSELSKRLSEAEAEDIHLTSLTSAEQLRLDAVSRSEMIGEYGIPPIDSHRPIMKTRYTVLIGKPNLGKTTIAMNWVVGLLISGRKVAIFSEETPASVLLYEYILPIYIYRKYGFFATYEQIVGLEDVGGLDDVEAAERSKIIKMAVCDVVDGGNYYYISALNAWTIYDDLARIYSEFKFEFCVLDHSLSIGGGGETTPRLNAMSGGIKRFKNEFKTSMCLLSHPSPNAKSVVSREGAAGLTKYSKQIEGDADDVFFMFDTPELESRGLIGFIQTKGRGASKVLEVMYLTKVFKFKVFRYDPSVQPSALRGSELAEVIPGDDDESEDSDYDENF
jgi:hypothetical protein